MYVDPCINIDSLVKLKWSSADAAQLAEAPIVSDLVTSDVHCA